MRPDTYRATMAVTSSLVAAYLLLLCFPQAAFAHKVVYKTFTVYSSDPPGRHLPVVLDRAESLLAASPINDRALATQIVLLKTPARYSALSLYLGGRSFGKSFAALPPDNVFINACDLAQDLVFRDAGTNNTRSLSGVIAHEVTHLLVRRKFGYWRNLAFPAWKKEGYADYVAGGSTLPYAIGVKMWKERPANATGYQYFKNYMLVKYLLEHEKLTVDDLFDRRIDVEQLAAIVVKIL
jgi:hypothetical protein